MKNFLIFFAALLPVIALICCQSRLNHPEGKDTNGTDIIETTWGNAAVTEDETGNSDVSSGGTDTSGTDNTSNTSSPPETSSSELPEAPGGGGSLTAKGYSIDVRDGVTYVDGVLIANKTYALPETYAPGGLTEDTYSAFMEMQEAASAEGLYLFVKSGYRSYIDQKIIYAGYAERDGAAAADRYSARAGHSEHQSGMAIDVNSTDASFGETPEGIWLRENCHLYGFIIRYPQDKEDITGYMYEPWHIRYVGRALAKSVKDSGLCLEEYFGITSIYG